MHTYIHTCMHTYIKHMHRSSSTRCPLQRIHIYIHTYIHTYTHTHIHTYIHAQELKHQMAAATALKAICNVLVTLDNGHVTDALVNLNCAQIVVKVMERYSAHEQLRYVCIYVYMYTCMYIYI